MTEDLSVVLLPEFARPPMIGEHGGLEPMVRVGERSLEVAALDPEVQGARELEPNIDRIREGLRDRAAIVEEYSPGAHLTPPFARRARFADVLPSAPPSPSRQRGRRSSTPRRVRALGVRVRSTRGGPPTSSP